MTKLKKAKFIKEAFDLLCGKTSHKASQGCNKSARELLEQMTLQNLLLKDLGYWLTDDGKLTIEPPKPDPRYELAMKASKGDSEAAEELLKLMSGNDVY